MAGVFGAALMTGVAAGLEGSTASLAVIALCLVAVAALTRDWVRRLTLALVAGFVFGAVGGAAYTPPRDAASLPLPEVISAQVEADPRLTPGGQLVRIAWTDADGTPRNAPLIIPYTVNVGRGDRIVVSADERRLVAGLIIADTVDVEETAGRVERVRRELRRRATVNVLAQAPGSNGSLALGLLIGDDSGLTQAQRQDMRASGLSHITAVSGSNVAMVIFVVAYVLAMLIGRSWHWLLPQLAAVALYVWIVGAEPPIVRAAIMGSLALVAIGLGRPAHLFTLLFLAGGLMALHDPGTLSTLSFQLSFLSMLALGVVGTHVHRMEGRGMQIAAILAAPAAAAIATAPLIALRFGAFSLGTVPANVLVAPVIAPATALAALVALLGEVSELVAVAGELLWFLTGFILEVSRFVGRFPGAYWTFAPPDGGAIVLTYLLLAGMAAPLVPEARLAAARLRGWAAAQPAAAFSSAVAALALLWALTSLSN